MLVQQVSMESKQRITSLQELKEQINLLQLQHPQIVRRTSSTTPVPATPTTRVRPHRKLHNRYRPASRTTSPPAVLFNETQGVFTSAPATPESQQKLIVLQAESSTNPDHSPDQPSTADIQLATDSADQHTSPADQPADQHTSLTDQPLMTDHISSIQHTPTDQHISGDQQTPLSDQPSQADHHTPIDQNILTGSADQDTDKHMPSDQEASTDQHIPNDQYTPTDILLTDQHSSSDNDSEHIIQP